MRSTRGDPPPQLEDGCGIAEVVDDPLRREQGEVASPSTERRDLAPPLGGESPRPSLTAAPPHRSCHLPKVHASFLLSAKQTATASRQEFDWSGGGGGLVPR